MWFEPKKNLSQRKDYTRLQELSLQSLDLSARLDQAVFVCGALRVAPASWLLPSGRSIFGSHVSKARRPSVLSTVFGCVYT